MEGKPEHQGFIVLLYIQLKNAPRGVFLKLVPLTVVLVPSEKSETPMINLTYNHGMTFDSQAGVPSQACIYGWTTR